MSHHEACQKAVEFLGAALDRFYWEGNSQRQIYSKNDILNLSIGLPIDDPAALDFLINTLRYWNRKGYIQLNEVDERLFVKVTNPDFSLSESFVK